MCLPIDKAGRGRRGARSSLSITIKFFLDGQ